MIRRFGWLLAFGGLALPSLTAAQVAAPRLKVRTVKQLPTPLPAPYEAGADARADIAAAGARARKSGKRLLIDFGANWCADCRVFAGVIALPEMRPWMAKHFELVTVDVGRFNRNMDMAEYFGIKLYAIPAIFVIDPKGGKLLNRSEVLSLGDSTTLTPPQTAAWLGKWAKP